MEYILVTAMVVGVVELIRRIEQKDWYAALTILASAVVGALCGVFSVEGITVVTGIVVGLAASGLVTVAKGIGTK